MTKPNLDNSIELSFRPPIPEWMRAVASDWTVDALADVYSISTGDERAYYAALIAVKLGGLTFDLAAANRWHEQGGAKVAGDQTCPICNGLGWYMEDVCGDGGPSLRQECECQEGVTR